MNSVQLCLQPASLLPSGLIRCFCAVDLAEKPPLGGSSVMVADSGGCCAGAAQAAAEAGVNVSDGSFDGLDDNVPTLACAAAAT